MGNFEIKIPKNYSLIMAVYLGINLRAVKAWHQIIIRWQMMICLTQLFFINGVSPPKKLSPKIKSSPNFSVFFWVEFRQISAWKIWFPPMQRISLRKEWPKFARFWREKNSKSPNFYNKFQQVAKNIYKVFFLISYVARSG